MKQPQKRLLSLIFSLILLILTIFVFSSYVSAAYDDVNELRAEFLTKQDALDGQRQIVEKVNELLTRYQSIPQLAEVMALAVPNGEQTADAFNQIRVLAERNKLSMSSFSTTQGSAFKSVSPNASGLLREMGSLKIEATLLGSYSGLDGFLTDLASNIRIMDIESLKVQPAGSAGGDFFFFNIVITTYYQTTE
ncbi:MAG: hypothetical protein COU09_00200 [Candidatus Harrisonbacteria bacterium CG10_big_fil_rev_8_21_14_0_10_44_23]|uniref:Pilus assembly protein PilO n=1 Tax=Candidatus Harrisonbacteria bacterium CG10_big_fil_rev_8_21_14_0_10_44_23 TaxID=1974585 RepID=A0A2H0USR5_9BACT|nr:MAG: hypothetical protein COU09_00200 [Candidatus Harrisonbacteria bacterium CG10_big_fil_rev_8_21_14_0_10_44_23]